jgi:hypothetical protein
LNSLDQAVTAREKYACPACGAEAHWNPAKQALICPFCGTESPVKLERRGPDTVVVEHNLAIALRDVAGSERGWPSDKVSVKCQSCHAVSAFDPERVGQRCDFCGSSQLVPYDEVKQAFRPESLLAFQVSESQARDRIRDWYGRQWLAPNALKRRALTDTVHGIYLPYWTFDALTHTLWTAEAGHYYYERVNGKQQRRVRWSPSSGERHDTFDDELVPASRGVHAALLQRIGAFPTAALVPYDAGYLAGWTVERYQIDLAEAAAESRRAMEQKLREWCAGDVPGDTYRNLRLNTTWSGQTFKHVLVPVWLLTYTYGAQSYQVVANGVTGAMAGERPYSWVKIALLVLLALIVIYVIAMGD